jgi:hypothetical protein
MEVRNKLFHVEFQQAFRLVLMQYKNTHSTIKKYLVSCVQSLGGIILKRCTDLILELFLEHQQDDERKRVYLKHIKVEIS